MRCPGESLSAHSKRKLCADDHILLAEPIYSQEGQIALYGACHEYHHDDVLGRSAYASRWDHLEPHFGMAAATPLPPRAGKSERRHTARYRNHALRLPS